MRPGLQFARPLNSSVRRRPQQLNASARHLTRERLLNKVPILLTSLRALLAPIVVLLALVAPIPRAFALCLVTAFFSDIFDGIVARRLGVATPNLRRLDTLADSLFYAAATFAAWHLHPSSITSRWLPLTLLAVMELCRYTFDFMKFRREASYHMWSSKAWGIALFMAFFSLLVLDSDNGFVDLAIYVGIASDLEGLAISAVLRKWQSDIPSLIHALRLRTSEQA